jgi:Tol biopolymer transport system component
VAYRAGGQIWVRDLGNLEPRAVAMTDRPIGRIFWTADSRFVVYGASTKVMRVPAAGGAAEAVADQSPIIAGGVGLPDGGLVVSSTPFGASAASTVRIDNGVVHPVKGLDVDLSGGVSLLPDGNRFVYSLSERETRNGVYIASIDGTRAPERLLTDTSDVAYVPSVTRSDEGYLLVVRQGTLLALPVDAARLQSRGEPIELAKGVANFTASSGDSLVYRLNAGRRLTWYDRRGTATGTAWSPAPYMEVALSPNADRVAVVRADPPTTWIHDFARESSVKAATTLPVAIKPQWSPAGDRILLLSTRSGQQIEFYTVPSGGGPEEIMFRTPMVAYPTSWSRDSRWLLVTGVNPRTKEDLWVAPLTGNVAGKAEPFLVTDNKETDGQFSPDGRAVAYVSDESGASNVYVRSFPSSGGNKWKVSADGGFQPRWRGDGKELFYLSPTGQLMSVEITPGIATAPGRPTPLFQTSVFGGGASVNNFYWDVTADGQRFLINTVIGGAEPSTLNVVLNWQSGLSR